jgi:hypothetical protein
VDSAKVLTAAAAAPGWDRILVVVNDTTYGGSGGSVVVVAMNASAVPVAQHEFGHSFTCLADEYSSAYPGYPACSDLTSYRPCEANVTDQTASGSVKWSSWISASTPLPTMGTGADGVGLYQGARYQATGVYRPQHDCLMKTLGAPFCAICAQEFVRMLYKGGWGNPAQGIDVIEPGTESPAIATATAALGGSLPFSVDLLQPAGDTVSAAWTVNGQAAGTGSAFNFKPSGPGTYTVTVVARDASRFVGSAMAAGLLGSTRTWTVTVPATAAACGSGLDGLCVAVASARPR